MGPNGQDITPYIGYSCFPLLLIFPAALYVPVFNYLVSLAVVFAVIFLAVNKMNVLLTVGLIGSFGILLLIHGFMPWVMSFWAMTTVPAAVFGKTMNIGMTPRKAFFIGAIIATIFSLLFFLVIREPLYESIDAMSGWIGTMLGTLDTSESLRADLADNFKNMFEITKRLSPAFMVLNGIGLLFVGWLILKIMMDMLHKFHPGMGSFIYWKMPQVYIYITGLFILMRLVGPEVLQAMADNVLLFLGFFYAVFGFAVMEYYLKKIRLSLFLKVLFYIGIVFLQLPGLLLAALIGIFDSYFDFRKVRARIIG
ncbi:MAG: hypothetical protein DRP46_02945 [Candidatus Zixiibacteriota bacterium]|nr:MAG: hypothetical protein DRP46_02945 [candidate division Zixibacteria bacterium]